MNWLKQQAANIAGTAEPIYGPSALQSVAKQAETTPYTELKKDDLKWTVMDSTNVETQVFYFFTDSGHIGMAQVIYSNVAGIRTTAQFNLKIQYSDKSPHLWSANGLENYGFDSTKTCFYADSVAVDLSEDGSYYTIKSAVNENSIVNLKVTRAAPGFQAGVDGKSYFGTDPKNPWGSMRHAFWPRAKAEGTIVTKKGNVDFAGKAMFIHALQGMKPHHAAARWNFVNFQTPTYSAVMMEYTTPPSYGSSVVNVGGLAIDGEILTAGCTNSAKVAKTRQDPDWPEPGAMEFKWEGKTKDDKKITAELSGDLGERLDKVDVMAEVPGFVKSIIGGVAGTRPFIFQYGPKDWELKIQIEGAEPKVEKGNYFGESTFISE